MSKKIIFLRGGGLGDFILTLPLLQLARSRYEEVVLYTRAQYAGLLNDEWAWLEVKNLDELSGRPPPMLGGSAVVSFWMERGWLEEMTQAGASSVFAIPPRPADGDHFVSQALGVLGWEAPKDLLFQPMIGNAWRDRQRTLWIHPGSGAGGKNLPMEYFIDRAHQWISSKREGEVIFSLGEADERARDLLKQHVLCQHPQVSLIEPATVQELKNQLSLQADQFLGNDSGPGHLAAGLGLPVEIWYVQTASTVWRPVGPRVKTYDWLSDSSRIL